MKITREELVYWIIVVATSAFVIFVAVSVFSVINKDKMAAKQYQSKENVQAIYGQSQNKDVKANAEAYVVSSLERVFLDGYERDKTPFSREIKVMSARNEYESVQVVIKTGTVPLNALSFVVSDLVNVETGGKIEKKNIQIRTVGYVETKKPYYPVKYVGMWPDILVPVVINSLTPGVTQPVWVTFYVPFKVAAGMYRGNIQVMNEGVELQSIPVELGVYAFTLPQESHLKTAFDLSDEQIRLRYPRKNNESELTYQRRLSGITEQYIVSMLKHRINPVLNVDLLSSNGLSQIELYRKSGLNNFSVGKRGASFRNNWFNENEDIEALIPLYRQYGESLKNNGLLQLHYIYIWSEVVVGDSAVARIASMIHRADPDLKNMVNFSKDGNAKLDLEWGKDIDIWALYIDSLDEEKLRQLRQGGKEVWASVSGPTATGSPTLVIDCDAIDYRIIPWMCWKYDVKGFFYWCVNWWPIVDPFTSAMNTEWNQNGNGLLYYPVEAGLMDSLRLEIFRDGMEDYEYLALLKDYIAELHSKGLAGEYQELVRNANEVLAIDGSLVASSSKFTKDGNMLLERRRKVAEMVLAVGRILGKE